MSTKKKLSRLTAVSLALCVLMSALLIAMPALAETKQTVIYEAFDKAPLPDGWKTLDEDGDGYAWDYSNASYGDVWIQSPSHYNNGSVKADNWLISPAIAIPGGDDVFSAAMSWTAKVAVYFYKEPYSVYVSTSPITSPSDVAASNQVFSETLWDDEGAARTVDLSAFRGKTVYIAFRHYTTVSGWTLHLHDFAVSVQVPSYCNVLLPAENEALSVTAQPGSSSPILQGQPYSFKVNMKDGYVAGENNANVIVKANGTVLTPVNGVYTIDKVMTDQTVTAELVYLVGDVNGDRAIDATDSLMTYQYSAGMRSFNPVQLKAADIDDNGFNSNDSLIVFQYVAGVRNYLDVNKDINYIWDNAYADAAGGFNNALSVADSDCWWNQKYLKDYSTFKKSGDSKFLFKNHLGNTRVVNNPDGYALTLPAAVTADYHLSALRSQYTAQDDSFVLTATKETKSPYGNNPSGWNIYLTEWLNRFVANDGFLSQNDLSRTRAVQESTSMLSGYTVLTYDIYIENDDVIDKPYYNIGIIRQSSSYRQFFLLVMKSKTQQNAAFDNIIRSFDEVSSFGEAQNDQTPITCTAPSYWNAETKAYYEQFCSQDKTDWGAFTYSMPGDTQGSVSDIRQKLTDEMTRLQGSRGWNHNMELMPTYTHIGWGSTEHSFPTTLANEFAGGNGKNGKPVFHFTYQFTTSNNGNLEGYTPIYDILRGDYDKQFHRLAKAIKDYGKPMFFRLNNEMNTDWTSYCGMVSLLDPDLFVATWERLYNIFREEGVDNCIWVFNPIAKSTPFCNWGEDLCYLPDSEYVQALGLTGYQDNNSDSLSSFEEVYTGLYEKNTPYYTNYPWIISEFGCGAGGEKVYDYSVNRYVDTVVRRNQATQAAWVTAMFNDLNTRKTYCSNIKGAIWFSCNDYCTIDDKDYIVNYYNLDDSLVQTLRAFRNGFAAAG